MHPRSTVVLVVLALVACAARAWADDAVVVLDRGRAAEAEAGRWTQDALRVVAALRARRVATRLIACGTRPDGRLRTATLDADGDPIPEQVATREGLRFEGPTDPRRALALALVKQERPGPLLVFLVGPFAGAAEPSAAGGEEAPPPRDDVAAEDGRTWAREAPEGSKVYPLGLEADALATVADLPGVVASATLVLAAGEAHADVAPYSPLADEVRLEARVGVDLDTLACGSGAGGPLLLAASSDGRGEVRPGTEDGDAAVFLVTRTLGAGGDAARVETLSFRAPEDPAVVWLADVPQPRTFQWTTLAPDARLLYEVRPEGGGGTSPADEHPFVVEEALVGRPVRAVYVVEQTRTGEAAAWTCRGEDGDLPEGLTVRVGERLNLSDEIARVEVEVAFEAQRGRPMDVTGRLVLEAAGHPRRFEIPYHVVVPEGRVRVLLDAPPEPLRLPADPEAPPFSLLVEEENPNAPPLVRVEAALDPPDLARALTARLKGAGSVEVGWDLAGPLEVRPGRRYELRLDLAPGVRTAQGTVALRLVAQRGVTGESRGRGRVEGRRPRLVVAADDWAYRMDGGVVTGDPPLALEVDPDGGAGPWRLALYETTPRLALEGDAPVAFELVPERPGRWVLRPTGAWRGARGDTFAARTDPVSVEVSWAGGAAPGRLELPVEVRPRWGRAGWILVALASLALALGLWGLLQLKAAPVVGTLLYQAADRPGAVGRLDLAPVGRRKTSVTQDEAGRLCLGGAGPPVLAVRPTRVGGLLEHAGPQGPERHLLVDGLTLEAGGYRVRYVSAHPGESRAPPAELEVEELLGPEFDLPTGRIGRLGRPDGEAADGGPRGDG